MPSRYSNHRLHGARTRPTNPRSNSRATTACSPHNLSTLTSRRSLYPERVPLWLPRRSESDPIAPTHRTTTAMDARRRIARRTSDSRMASSRTTARAAAAAVGDRAETTAAAAPACLKAPVFHMHRRLPCHHPQTLSHQRGRPKQRHLLLRRRPRNPPHPLHRVKFPRAMST